MAFAYTTKPEAPEATSLYQRGATPYISAERRPMPKGPRGEKRPADVIGAAVKVMLIATGEEEEELDRTKSAAAELGSRGGKARAAKMTPQRRAEIARKAAERRWHRDS
jgi:hypothetical protein